MGTLLVRERPSLKLSVLVQSPVNYRQRWGVDDPNPIFAPKDMSFGTTMPGGFDRFTATLERKPDLSYPDDDLMSTLTVQGNGGSGAWQGRIEKLPDTGGYQAQETVEAAGWQAALEDDNSAREIYVDQELSRWEAPSIERKIQLLGEGIDEEDASVGTAAEAEAPAITTQLTGPWIRNRNSEAWYDAKGIPIGVLFFAIKPGATTPKSGSYFWLGCLSADEKAVAVDFLQKSTEEQMPPYQTALFAKTNTRVWAMVRFITAGAGGEDGKQYPLYWKVAVYGAGLTPRYGGLSFTEAQGVLASDVVGHAIGKWASKLATNIVPSTFVIPQLAFLEPTTVAEIIKQATRFELQDWAVWEGPTFYMNPRGERGKKWKARVGPAQLQETGPQVSRIYTGVLVQFSDVAGKTRTVGPPGFAGGTAATEDSLLADPDPENPLNQVGVRKWAQLKMGTSTIEGAKAVGRIFLRESKQLDKSGQATLVGHVEDEQGNYWPAWAVRAGDTIRFADAADASARTITSTSYADSGKSNVLQLGQPSDDLQAVLERLSASIISTGLQ